MADPEQAFLAKHDLTHTMACYLDRHLVFPLLEFLYSRQIYKTKQLLEVKLDMLLDTRMIDFAIEIYHELHEGVEEPRDMKEKRINVVKHLTVLKDGILAYIGGILADEDVKEQLKSIRDGGQLVQYLEEHHKFDITRINDLYEAAKFQYDCGMYAEASGNLYAFNILVPANHPNSMNGLWGKLATDILNQDFEMAIDDLTRLKEVIDSNTSNTSDLQSLQERTWLMHWSLFVYFNHAKGKDLIIDQYLYEVPYLNAIQTMCPHILRYLTCAIVTHKRRRNVMKDLVKVIQQEIYTYRDPITEFIECLHVNFDFEGAQKKLIECDDVISNDFFLIAVREEFIENARLLIFETFCRIHQCISIDMLASKLNMNPIEAERWIVNLIRNAHLDAKIDSQMGHVVMGIHTPSPYQEVIEKTKALSFSTHKLVKNIEKMLAE